MPLAKRADSLIAEDFERLLKWLDEDRERAGLEYEKIRRRLTTIFASRGCRTPEDLADETIDRVSRRVVDIQDVYQGNKALYFLGVANNVHHEYIRRPALAGPTSILEDANKEQTFLCLDRCIGKLTERSQQLIRQYYAADKGEKIQIRQRLAKQLGVSSNALRARALRIREELQVCIERCVSSTEYQEW